MSEHGTRSMYNHGKCRCDACRMANRDYHRSFVERHRTHPLPEDDQRHGTLNGYLNYGCRCEPCTAANAEACAAYKSRTKS